jgi:very-short-patch-repair endonuclease
MQLDDRLRELATTQHNLIGRRQVASLGIDATQWRRMRAGPDWQFVTDRVLRLVGAAPSRGETVMAAVLDDGGRAWVSHSTAVWWWGVPGYRATPVQIVRTSRTNEHTALAQVHRVRRLDDRWVTVLDGVPVVRPEVAILHLCATEHPDRAARALDNAWNRRLLSGQSLIALLADYGKRGRNGTAVLRELMDARGPGYVPPASNLESRVRSILAKAGIDVRLQVDSGGEEWTGRVDLRATDRPLIIEVQSEQYHSALLDVAADDRRKAQLSDDGFVVVEVWDVDVWGNPDAVVELVRTAMAEMRRVG